jgi:hypothetical protein
MGAGATGKEWGAIAFILIVFRMPVVQSAGFITAIIAGATRHYRAGYVNE